MAINVNELIIDRVRYVVGVMPSTGEVIFRLTQIEEASLSTSATGEDVTDAVGTPITTLYRAKTAEFTATNSLFSLDLAAVQFGGKKIVGSSDKKIRDHAHEVLPVKGGKVTLSHTPLGEIGYIYGIKQNSISDTYKSGTIASAKEFAITGKGITVPTGLVDGDNVYIEYEFENENAVAVTNYANEFPKSFRMIAYVIFRDKCDENIVYAGKIIGNRAKMSAESVDIALNSTGKHSFTIKLSKDYCSIDEELFTIIVSE